MKKNETDFHVKVWQYAPSQEIYYLFNFSRFLFISKWPGDYSIFFLVLPNYLMIAICVYVKVTVIHGTCMCFFSSSRPKENWHTNSLVKESWFKLKLRELITCLVTRCIYLMTILNWGNIVEYHFDVTYTFLTLFTFLNKINEGIE